MLNGTTLERLRNIGFWAGSTTPALTADKDAISVLVTTIAPLKSNFHIVILSIHCMSRVIQTVRTPLKIHMHAHPESEQTCIGAKVGIIM